MVTIVTEIELRDGAEPKWDEVMRERMVAATAQPGWVGGQLLQPEGDPGRRVIVGTWRSREDWEQWHADPKFRATRAQLDDLLKQSGLSPHDVVVEIRSGGCWSAVA